MKKPTKSNISTNALKTRPLRHENDDTLLNDYEVAKSAVESIDDYTKRFGMPPKINPNFVQWLREGVKYVDNKQGSMVDYKNETVLKEFADVYDEIIANTERRNAQLEKKGEFECKIMEQIKGES